ncbi:DUF4426 domain-containing protein [Pseudoxanthomonas sp. 10H]|uniref:DUF4426 domain-containing protein n=1 Tax=Pseudoxanthomonas sp. 10H TaxID=3242729 RepID=UPI003555C5E5
MLLLFAACGGPAPEPARFVPPAPSVVELDGPLRARYNLLPTLALGEAVAREYGVAREADSALLVVALRRPTADGDETTAHGEVTAEAVDLAGRRQQVSLRRVATGDYIDHVGTVRIGVHDTMRVRVGVVAGGRRQEFDFQRNF